MTDTHRSKPVILVSSTVYGIEELLERIYALLNQMGYEVWMSHKGTVPVSSDLSALDNCIRAVEQCDYFLGLITSRYGSGINEEGLSITHEEMLKAKELNKPRWILVHDHVVFARKLLKNIGLNSAEKIHDKFQQTKNENFHNWFDLRVIGLYENALCSEEVLHNRKGNWVQKFKKDDDALLFATAQFSRFQEAEAFIQENLSIDISRSQEEDHHDK